VSEDVRLDGGPGMGQRVAAARRRRGLSRRVAAELCGRSDALRDLDRSPVVGTPAERRQRANVALAAALNHARDGAHADAWRWWDVAAEADRDAVADGLPLSPYALFGQDPSDVALALDVELGRSASALRRAEATDTGAIASVPRRTRLLRLDMIQGSLLRL